MAGYGKNDTPVEFGGYGKNDAQPSIADSLPKDKQRTVGGTIKDVGVTALKGATGLQQALVGIADIPTGGRVGKFLETPGRGYDARQKMLESNYSDAQQEANRKVGEAQGFVPTLKAAVQNPSTIATTIGESIPMMLGGAGVARGVMAAGKKVPAWAAGAIGEGVMGSGSAAEAQREGSDDRLLTQKQSVAALGSGAGTALFGAAGGKLANKLGIGDVDTILAQGGPNAVAAGAAKKGFIRQMAESGVAEGVFEELPQSVQEQMWQNYANEKPLTEGVGNAAAMGLLAGGVMGAAGGGYNALASSPAPAVPDANIQNTSPQAGMPPATAMDAADLLDQNQYGAVIETPGPRGIVETVPPHAVVETPSPHAVIETPSPRAIIETAAKAQLGTGPLGIAASIGIDTGAIDPLQVVDPVAQAAQLAASAMSAVDLSSPRAVVETPGPRAVIETAQGAVNGTAGPRLAEMAQAGGEGGSNLGAESISASLVRGAGNGVDTAAGDVAPGSGVDLVAGSAADGGKAVTWQPKTAISDAKQLSVEFDGQRYPVDSLADASDKWLAFSERTNAGVSEIGNGVPIYDQNGEQIAYVSYNGKVWPGKDYVSGMAPIHTPTYKPKPATPLPESGAPGAELTTEQQPVAATDNKLPAKPATTPPAVSLSAAQDNNQPIARVGTTPNSAEPVTVRKGVVYLGDYPAMHHESGDDITVPEGADFAQVKQALQSAGALSSKQKVYPGVFGSKKAKAADAVMPAAPVQPVATATQTVAKQRAKPVAKTSDEFGEMARKEFLQVIKKMGGITTKEASDITGEDARNANRMNVGLFRKEGNALDLVARRLNEAGYLSDEQYNDVDGGVQATRDLINQALGKNPVMTTADQDRYNELLQQEQDLVEQEDELEADMPAGDVALATILEADEADLPDFNTGETDPAAQMRAMGFNEDEIDAELKARQGAEAAGGTATGAAQEGGRTGEGEARTEAGTRQEGGFELAAQTPAQVAAAEDKAKKEAEKAEREANKASGPDVTADQVDMFNTQGGLFGGNREEATPAKRFETGATLTKEQRKTVLASLVDVYKQKNAEKETRINANGDEYLAYPHQPELFEKSDITGAMVRYYVTMPDGRIAHPTELFPDYTQSDIDAAIQKQRNDDDRDKRIAIEVERNAKREGFSTPEADSAYWQEKSDNSKRMTAHGGWSIAPPSERVMFTKDGLFYSLYKDAADQIKALKSRGWNEPTPSPLTKEAKGKKSHVNRINAETGETINEKVAPLVEALNASGLETQMSGDLYGDDLVYVDLTREAARKIEPASLPAPWVLTYKWTPITNRDVLGIEIPKNNLSQLQNHLAADIPRRISRKGGAVSEAEAERIVSALTKEADKANQPKRNAVQQKQYDFDNQDKNFYYTIGNRGMKSDGTFTDEKRFWMTFTRETALPMDANNEKPYGATERGTFTGTVSGDKLIRQPKGATPQIMTESQFDSVIKIAADSIEKLRKQDVERVLDETPAPFKIDMVSRIKARRPDLAEEVDAVMDEATTPKVATEGGKPVATQEAKTEDAQDKAPITEAERETIAVSAVEQADAVEPAQAEFAVEPVTKLQEAQAKAQEDKIGDFGRKVIVRKDEAQPTGKRMKKAVDERPAWARPYHAMQIQQVSTRSITPDTGRWKIVKESGGMRGAVQPVGRNTFATEQAALDAIPFAEVSRNHRVYSYEGKETTAAELATEIAEGRKNADDWLQSVVNDIKAIEDEHGKLLMSTKLTESFRKRLANGSMTQEQFDTLLAKGTVLSDAELQRGKAIQAKIDAIKGREMKPTAAAKQYGIYRMLAEGKKRALVKGGFTSNEEAMKYMATNPVEIIEHKFAFPERPWLDKIERTGKDRRTQDVTEAMFKETFAPGGVVYGNWLLNEDGTVNADGQALSNHSYDALMDLADTLGVTPKALFLNGDMVLGLGADGKGGKNSAAAHYSPGKVLINLTKINGAGSLAHEWWHSVDHYFARNGGHKDSDSVVSGGYSYKSEARPELMNAIKAVVDTMMYAEKSKTTDADIVRNSAQKRLDESLKSFDYHMNDLRNPYKPKKTFTLEQIKQWDALVEKLRNGEQGEQVYIENPSKSRGAMGYMIGTNLRDLNAIYKSVVGRSFLRTDPNSTGRRLHWIVESIKENKAKIDAKDDVTTVYKGRTEFYLEAREIDGYRSSDYWSTPEEMGARAFESYIFDKLTAGRNRSDYLVYAVENRYYAGLDMKPYPEGAERKAINGAFDNLFDTVQTKETDTGTAMFSRTTEQPAFYSQLSRAIESAPDKVFGGAGQFKMWLNSNAAKLGIKKDEIAWSGIEDYLDMQGKGKVSKADVVGFLSENGTKVDDVVLADISESDIELFLGDEAGEGFTREEAIDYLRQDQEKEGATKFASYTPPGGIPGTYREILVTLPGKSPSPYDRKLRGQMEYKQDESGKWNIWDRDDWVFRSGFDTREAVEEYASGDDQITYVPDTNNFRSSHFDQPNILVHLRTDEVTGADGKRYLRVVEVQSDWGQKGKKEGFGNEAENLIAELEEVRTQFRNGFGPGVYDEQGRRDPARHEALQTRLIELDARVGSARKAVPAAPFVTDTRAWVSLGIKRAIQQAVSSGVDGIVFATGQQNADLYDLSKQLKAVTAIKSGDGYHIFGTDTNDNKHDYGIHAVDALPDVVGKDLAEKIANQQTPNDVYRGLDLKVGGEGMRAFYDTIVPSVANDVLKKLGGGKVGQVDIDGGLSLAEIDELSTGNGRAQARIEARAKGVGTRISQPGFLIPESLKAKVSEGLPLFQRGRNNEAPTTGQVLTDEAAQRDIRFLESAINKYYGGKKEAKGAYEAAPLPDAGLGIIARAFGSRLRVFRVRGNVEDFGFFNGVYISGNRDTVYVNETIQRPHLAILGHELVHQLRKTNPKLYDKLAEQVKPYIRQDRYSVWAKLWPEQGDKLLEEFMAEVVSDGFMDKTFWQAMAKKNRSLVQQIYVALAKLLNKAFGQHSPKTESILTDYAEVMRIAGEVMAEAGMNPDALLKMNGVDKTMFHRVFHGTPHIWQPEPGFPHGRPRLDKMGSGEGAQAYGWGWYSAEAPEVAEGYRHVHGGGVTSVDSVTYMGNEISGIAGMGNAALRPAGAADPGKSDRLHKYLSDGTNLSIANLGVGATPAKIKALFPEWSEPNRDALQMLITTHGDANKAAQILRAKGKANAAQIAIDTAEQFKVNALTGQDTTLYQLDIPDASLPYLLDWDKPLSEQTPEVRGMLVDIAEDVGLPVNYKKKVFMANITGEDFYRAIAGKFANDRYYPNPNGEYKAASEYLASWGIIGNRYLDGNSRNEGKGSSNYVLWDQPTLDKVALLERNGEKLDAMREAAFSRTSQTETEAFRNWFKDSKVVDSDGKPLVVYRGRPTDNGTGKIRPNSSGLIFLSPEPGFANDYAGAMWDEQSRLGSTRAGQSPYVSKNYVRAENLFDIYEPENFEKYRARFGEVRARSASDESIGWLELEDKAVIDWIKSEGFDGLLISEYGVQNYAVFSPNQIKSAIGNNGNFDASNPDIRFSRQSTIPGTTTPQAPQLTQQPPLGIPPGTSGNQASWDAPENTGFDNLVYKLQNKQIDLKRVIEAVKKTGAQLADKWNPYLQEELFHGRAAKRTLDFVERELNPLLKDAKERGLELDEIDQYLHARHAEEANKLIASRDPNMQDGGSGMTTADAQAHLAGLSPDKARDLTDIAAKIDAVIANTRQLYADYGLIDQDTVDGWADMFKYYVPLMREDKDGAMGIGQGFSIKGREVKHRTGSTRSVVDILANIALQREKVIVRGEKNRVAVSLAGLTKLNPNPDFWTFDKVPTERVLNEKTGLVEERSDPMFKSRDNVIVAKIKGKNGQIEERAIVFNESNERAMRMSQAMKNLDVSQLEGLMGASAKITRYIASVNTQYNPVFGFVNLTRDVQGAMLNLATTPLKGARKEIFGNVFSALPGIYRDARAERKGGMATSGWAQLWEDFNLEGGQTGYRDMFATSEDRANKIKNTINPNAWMDSKLGHIFTANGALKVPLAEAQKGAQWIFDLLSDFNLAFENAVRVSAYKAGIDRGLSKQQSASLAKNLTTNFNRKGQAGQQAGALYAFFNASMQGTARIAETLTTMEPGKPETLRLSKAGKAIVGGGVLLGVMQAVAMAAAGFDDDEPPEFVKERNVIIPTGMLTGKKTYVTIPMPLGFHFIPNIGRVFTEIAMNGGKDAGKRTLGLLGVAAEAFNPLGGTMSLQTVAPTAIDPFVALGTNTDWNGRPIYREDFNKLAPTPGFARTKDTASSWAKWMSESINTITGGTEYTPGAASPTPDEIDYLVAQLTGGVGREIGKVNQTVTAMASGEELPTYKIPLFGRYLGSSEGQAPQATKFYDNLKRANEMEAEIKGRRKDGLPVAGYLSENRGAAALASIGNSAERKVSNLRKLKRQLIERDAPTERIKMIDEQITRTMTMFNERSATLDQ